MKKRYLAIMLTMIVSLLCGCGEAREDYDRDSRRESKSREESQESHGQSEKSPESEAEQEIPEEPLLSSRFVSARPGNELQFGVYEQDNNLSNGAEPIEWVVLANDGDKILVLSKYVLDAEGANLDHKTTSREGLTWAKSPEREWLNGSFYEGTFSEEEKRCILKSEITTPDTQGTWSGRSDQPFHTWGGDDTVDFLFFLSYEEVKQYVQPLGIATAKTTDGSSIQVNSRTGYSKWLLRSPGCFGGGVGKQEWPDDYKVTAKGYSACFSAIDTDDGDQYSDVYFKDELLERDSVFEDGYVGAWGNYGIRPAMWLKVK